MSEFIGELNKPASPSASSKYIALPTTGCAVAAGLQKMGDLLGVVSSFNSLINSAECICIRLHLSPIQ